MDAFFAAVPIRRKTRVHFHAFMRDVHDELRDAQGARTIRSRPSPRASRSALPAHLLRRVPRLRHRRRDDPRAAARRRCSTHGVVFVMTSNYPPDGLYPNGLQRERFLPAIELLIERGSTSSRSTAASTTGCARSSSVETCLRARRRRRPTRRWQRTFDAMAQRAGRGPRELVDRGPHDRRAAARGQRRLVRLRRAVRRPALAARLPRARARFAVLFVSGIPGARPGASPTRRAASPGSSTSCTIIA